ncbi:MAG TPA: DUF488 family protein [Chloroflexota bacterium]|nr:DUF488 family protein [Chloroflexota bacterium]
MSNSSDRIAIKRAYEEPGPDDGFRVLIDRLWPRGMKKETLSLDGWMKEIAPSDELRRWFGHDPAKWEEFRRRYREELSSPERSRLANGLVHYAEQGKVTLVYGAKDEEHNDAVVLRELLLQRLSRPQRRAA